MAELRLRILLEARFVDTSGEIVVDFDFEVAEPIF